MREIAILLVLAALFTATPMRAASSADAVLAEARAALEGGDAAHARHLADEGLAAPGLEPLARARLLLDRGLAFELMGSHDLALIDFTAAINAHILTAPEQAQALLQRGFLLDSQGHLNDALGDYTAAIRLTPDAAGAALNNRANIYRRQNKLEQAKRDYLAALKGNPHAEYPYTGLGQIAEAEGDIEAARRDYAKAAAANAHYAPAIDRLAALGGPPPDSVTEPGTVHLRAPGAAPVPVDPPLVLKPPSGAAAARKTNADPPIHLHMPAKRAHNAPSHKAPSRKAPLLRPAIDGPANAPLVQLGAWRSQAEAEAGWVRAQAKAEGALDGLANVIQPADIPGRGRYFRLRVAPGPFGAKSLCGKLKVQGLDCLVVAN